MDNGLPDVEQANRGPGLKQAVEWRVPIWGPAAESLLQRAKPFLESGQELLEIGFGSGLMSCYLASVYKLRITALETDRQAVARAEMNAIYYGLQDQIDFRLLDKNCFSEFSNRFELVFIKSLLYQVPTMDEYRVWLDALAGLLGPGGKLLALENGQGGRLDWLYRNLMGSRWADFMLFNTGCLKEMEKRFSGLDVRCFGRVSQFFCWSQRLCSWWQKIEQTYFPPKPNCCFIASILATK